MAKQKVTENFVIDDMQVSLVPADVKLNTFFRRLDEHGNPIPVPMERSRYDIVIDGVRVGQAYKGFGIGKQAFEIERLAPETFDPDFGDYIVHRGGSVGKRGPNAEHCMTTEDVARMAVHYRKKMKKCEPPLSYLPSEAEINQFLTDVRAVRAAQAEKAKLEREKEKAEREARALAYKAAEREILDGLTSIRDRFSGQLTNFERNALEEAIARVKVD